MFLLLEHCWFFDAQSLQWYPPYYVSVVYHKLCKAYPGLRVKSFHSVLVIATILPLRPDERLCKLYSCPGIEIEFTPNLGHHPYFRPV